MDKLSKIFICGHNGLVGSAILRRLNSEGYSNLILKNRSELDLLKTNDVNNFFNKEKPDYVFLAAAKVGGIQENNNYPADFIYQNILLQTNVIHASYINKVKKLCFLGSSCIYPRLCNQPIKEEDLLSGFLEPTNEAYAISKIAGIKMCEAYKKQYGFQSICAMPTNLYGYNDNFDLESSHVLPALIRKFVEAKRYNKEYVSIWGDGSAKREFLFSDDLADGLIFLMKNYNDNSIINIGTGKDISILELANKITDIVGYKGKLIMEKDKPNGTPRKVLNVNKINNLGWSSATSLDDGLKKVINWFNKKY